MQPHFAAPGRRFGDRAAIDVRPHPYKYHEHEDNEHRAASLAGIGLGPLTMSENGQLAGGDSSIFTTGVVLHVAGGR